MTLDALTLMAAGSFLALLGGVVLWTAWTQIRSAPALLWWSAADLMLAVGVGSLTIGFGTHAPAAFVIGSGVIPIGAAMFWIGARKFRGGRVQPLLLLAVPVVWLILGRLPIPDEQMIQSRVVTFAMATAFLLAAAVEFWRGRDEKLMARWPLMAVFVIHAAMFAGGIPDLMLGNLPSGVVPELGSWFSLIHFEQMIFVIGSAVFMVVMCRERVELEYKNASRLDPLTGVANRRAFFERAERIVRRCREDGAPCSFIVFDLDHFKQINDTHGHGTGDDVLRIFTDTSRATLRPNDALGRHGGEEFAVVLPGTATEAAFVIAERVRHAFADSTQNVNGLEVRATVSAGVAGVAVDADVEATMELADRALYRAKRLGRNRVVRADDPDGDDPSDAANATVIRVA